MSVFKYRADIVPVSIFTGLFLADLLVFFLVPDRTLVCIWAILGLLPKIAVCCWNHHHQHVPTFKSTVLNRLLELVYTFQTGITTNAWVLHHNLGHHINYLDQTKDESRWMRPDGTTMGEWEYTVKLALTGYLDAYRVGRKHPKYQRGLLSMGTLSSILLALAFYYNWFAALLLFAIPMFAGYITTCWHTYSHHAGLHSDDHFEASYNVMHRWYNIITGNLGYHTAHHWKQAVHWSKLPELHEAIKDKIPEELYRDPPLLIRWLPTT
ncbi:MAG: fatty acid desaturase [Bdellovibrionales bacterium]|nr:fatty acid desaturase [Bdellovibrionales bacterium]